MAGVSSVLQSLLDVVFPPRCVGCHTPGALLCQRCRATITHPQPPLCARCGRRSPSAGVRCAVCAAGYEPLHLTALRAATTYEGVRRLAQPLAGLLVAGWRRDALAPDTPAVEVVAHVPLHAI